MSMYMCGKISKLMVKYPWSYGHLASQNMLWAGLSDDVDMDSGTIHVVIQNFMRNRKKLK